MLQCKTVIKGIFSYGATVYHLIDCFEYGG